MKTYQWFLLAGLSLSVASKVLQWRGRTRVGNGIVIPAATCLVLALLFVVPPFVQAYEDVARRGAALRFAAVTCTTVALFQVMMISFVGRRWRWGLLLLGCFAAGAAGAFASWGYMAK